MGFKLNRTILLKKILTESDSKLKSILNIHL